MEVINSHVGKNITLILFLSPELLLPSALTCDVTLHNTPKREKSRNIIMDRKSLKFSAL